MTPFIYLASQSPRRGQLLDQLGVKYQLLLPEAGEDAESLEAMLPRELPDVYVVRVTQLKLDAALLRREYRGLPPAPILCADTTVALGRQILGKPANLAQARHMLLGLSGKTHRVLTAVAVGTDAKRDQALNVSRVSFAPLSDQQIDTYAASGEPLGKAGAYGVQGKAAEFIERIYGSYSGIMGLPLCETASLLRAFRVDF